MIFVERSAEEPASLSSAATVQQQQDAANYYATWSPGDAGFGGFDRYKQNDIKVELKRLFHQKCAYCEKKLEKGFFEVEHYRPKSAALGNSYPGYWWLALKWNNLLPTCPGCNKGLRQHIVTAEMTVTEVEALQAAAPTTVHGKAVQFPVGGPRLLANEDNHDAEEPFIIDPTRIDPCPELHWRNDATYSVLEPSVGNSGPSIRGSETIRCLALNRIDLVQARTAKLSFLKATRERIMHDLETGLATSSDPAMLALHLQYAMRGVDSLKLHAEPDQPFSAMAQAFVDDFADELREYIATRAAVVEA
ncbi:hypothetical protein [Nitratireductor sp. GZWM139]|uniref:hypothetical protein n=1 Tax=Nitratireductor sp. GZWM139 TaxID=2950541 RepID=UPI0024BEF9CE|nr:hypothetical protein [Nitratireductor sp. GZWM139]MDJ1465962.1 hypothetical protein [Nitratireductor sp. GZWM139]